MLGVRGRENTGDVKWWNVRKVYRIKVKNKKGRKSASATGNEIKKGEMGRGNKAGKIGEKGDHKKE